MFDFFKKKSIQENTTSLDFCKTNTYIQSVGSPVWSDRNYYKLSQEAYINNVIAHRCISMISTSAASVKFNLYKKIDDKKHKVDNHFILNVLNKPNLLLSGFDFFYEIFSYKLISGNAYVNIFKGSDTKNIELTCLRPDRVTIISCSGGMTKIYRYQNGNAYKDYKVNIVDGSSNIIHFKNFHPLNDWYGLSAIEAAAYSIDQHNQAGIWNQSLLQNGARPSGALVLQNSKNGEGQYLSEDQYNRIKQQIEDKHSGSDNSGKPLLLEGGLDWKEMSISPRDMDFINAKNSSARDIALAFGVPPQLLGIPGDNTYSNMAEARLALWEQTIIPQINSVYSVINNKLLPMLGFNDYEISYDVNSISALSPRRESMWNRVKDADFLSDNEKRELLGFGVKKDD